MCTVCVDSTHTSHIPFQHTEPPLPPRDRLQVPGPPRGPRRALVRPGAIQAAPNTQPWVLCVSLTALVISLHVVVGKKKKKRKKSGGLQGLLLWRIWRSHKAEIHLALMSVLKGYTNVFLDIFAHLFQITHSCLPFTKVNARMLFSYIFKAGVHFHWFT